MTEEIPQSLIQYVDMIEQELRTTVSERPSPLYRMMEYHLGWVDEQGEPTSAVGKRLRPALCLLSDQILGGDPQLALPCAAAVELIHNFSLIHDDIQDGAPERHHRATLWWIWGPAQAINAGDGMHSLARLALFKLTRLGVPAAKSMHALELLDDAAVELCEGQFQDLEFQERMEVGVNTYLKMTRQKTGALFGCAMELGVLLATDAQERIAAFGECGRKLGTAFQIRDDVLDLWTGDDRTESMPPGDILSKKKTLPLVYAMEQGTINQKRRLGGLYLKRVLDPKDIPEVLTLLDEVGARDYAQAKAEALCEEALEELQGSTPRDVDLSPLYEIADFLVHRTL